MNRRDKMLTVFNAKYDYNEDWVKYKSSDVIPNKVRGIIVETPSHKTPGPAK